FRRAGTARGCDLGWRALVRPAGAAPGSVRLELFRADPRGRLTPRGGPRPAPPPDGPPTLDTAALVPLPPGPLADGRTWELSTDGWVRTWRAAGTEPVKGSLCRRLEAEQQSDDWERPDPAGPPAWRRPGTLWLGPHTRYPPPLP